MASFFPRIGAGRRSSARRDRSASAGDRKRRDQSTPSSRATTLRDQRNRAVSARSRQRWTHLSDRVAKRLSEILQVQSQPRAQVTRLRLAVVWGILLLAGLVLAANLYRLQVVDAAKLQQRAQAQQITDVRPFVPRRSIVDARGNVLAIDRPAYTLYAHPIMFHTARRAVAEQLAPILDQSVESLTDKMLDGDSGIELSYALPEDVADRVKNLGLDGIELVQHPQRLYPQEDLFANVVGYVNLDREGKAGLEMGQQKQLERSIETVRLRRSGNGTLMPISTDTNADAPHDLIHQDDLRLQLTLDARLQRAARYALQQKVTEFEAKRGAAMAIDVRTGALKAMVSVPSFDPNEYYEFDVERFRNWTVSNPYEPGSTFKPINVAIALEAGAVRPDERFNDEGQIFVDGWPVQNNDYESAGGRGSLSLTEIIQYSSNVGMVHVMQRMQRSNYYDWLERIGLGKTVKIDLPDEVPGMLKTHEQFVGGAIEPATAAFGQGFTLTPIQLLQLHAMLANQGRMVTPHVIQGLYGATGKPMWQPDRPEARQIVSAQVARSVIEMMEAVVQSGTGKAAQIPGYRIAGKTGTAQKASEAGGYSNARITSFVSSFPAEAPRYTVLVVLDEPNGSNAFGSTTAAPVAKSMMEALIAIEQVPPSQPVPTTSPTP